MKRLLFAILGLSLAAGVESAMATGRPMPAKYLHPLFSDHCVLQRDVPVPVWGNAEPNAKLIVTFAGQTKKVEADAKGHWSCTLDPMKASFESRELIVANLAAYKQDRVKDVLVGEVWLCSGQSNMEMGITKCDEDEEIAKANHPGLRLLTIPQRIAYSPQESFDSRWKVCSPDTLKEGIWGGFSGTAYFFGRKLQEELKVPVGLILAAWGGTVVEAWTSGPAIARFKHMQDSLSEVNQIAQSKSKTPLVDAMDEWFLKHDLGTQQGWHKGTADTSKWREVTMPNNWGACGIPGHSGVVWMQREFEAPAEWEKSPMLVQLGTIADNDTTWINGVEIGRTNSFMDLRVYEVPAGVLKAGRNVITLRITNSGGGGIPNKQESMWIKPVGFKPHGETLALDLTGKWMLKETAKEADTGRPLAGNPNSPSVLYNGMIAPLAPATIKGAIWYQGEANTSEPGLYRELLPTMIGSWRTLLGREDMGFHIVSLANFMDAGEEPRDHEWASLREAQALTAKNVPHCGLAVAIDIGEAKDIHPKNKREVGRRLALSALERTYGKDVVGSGPWFREMKIEGDHLRMEFDYAEGLEFKGNFDKAFAIAGKEGDFMWAQAKIEGKSVIVSSPHISKPVAVRYAWDVNPQAPLYNAAGLPAVPFRTDEPH